MLIFIYWMTHSVPWILTLVRIYLKTDCIRGYLKEKAVLLVTHQLCFLEKVDEILINYEQLQLGGLRIEEETRELGRRG